MSFTGSELEAKSTIRGIATITRGTATVSKQTNKSMNVNIIRISVSCIYRNLLVAFLTVFEESTETEG